MLGLGVDVAGMMIRLWPESGEHAVIRSRRYW